MTPARKKRLFFIIFLVTGVAVAAGFAMYAFNQNLMFYFSPSEVKQGKAPVNKLFRMGGMVVDGSFKRQDKSLKVFFAPTDNTLAFTKQVRQDPGVLNTDRVLIISQVKKDF